MLLKWLRMVGDQSLKFSTCHLFTKLLDILPGPTCFENMFCLLPWHCPALLFWSPRVFQSLQFSVPKYLHHAAVQTSERGLYLKCLHLKDQWTTWLENSICDGLANVWWYGWILSELLDENHCSHRLWCDSQRIMHGQDKLINIAISKRLSRRS